EDDVEGREDDQAGVGRGVLDLPQEEVGVAAGPGRDVECGVHGCLREGLRESGREPARRVTPFPSMNATIPRPSGSGGALVRSVLGWGQLVAMWPASCDRARTTGTAESAIAPSARRRATRGRRTAMCSQITMTRAIIANFNAISPQCPARLIIRAA